MKKLLMKLLASLSAALGIIVMGATLASAQSSITNTGPNSNNQVTHSNNTSISISNTTSLACAINTTQNASSGSASVVGNTTGGSAMTGDASNNSATSCIASVNNNVFKPQKPAPTKPAENGGSGGMVSGVSTTRREAPRGSAKVAAASIEALPATGVNSVMTNLIGVAIGFVSVAIMWQLGLSLYKRYSLGQFSSGFAV